MKVNGEEIANVPNAITAARLVGVTYESVRYYQTGELQHFIKAGAYFLLDVFDGPAARRLNQVTNFGKKFDPVVDKISIGLLAGAAAARGEADPVPLLAVGAINVSNTLATVIASRRGTLTDEVGRAGKQSQLRMNAGFGLNVLGKRIATRENGQLKHQGNVLRLAGTALAVLGSVRPGLSATKGYWDQAVKPKS